MTDVFISYSRKDKDFVQVLFQALERSKYDAWVDWEDIPPTANWWEEIKAGIAEADAFIFVLSPDSVISQVCQREADYAARNHKRLVPILRREGFDSDHLISSLRDAQWLVFRSTDDFDQAFNNLVATLNTNLEQVKAHTRLLIKAVEWEKTLRDASLLLRGRDLSDAEQWLAHCEAPGPNPTGLQREYINASRSHQDVQIRAERRLRRGAFWGTLAAAVGLAIASAAGWFALRRTMQAQEIVVAAQAKVKRAEQDIAEIEQRAELAEREAEIADLRVQASNQRVTTAEQRVQTLNQQVEAATQRVQATDQQVQVAEQRVQIAEQQVSEAQQTAAAAKQLQQEAEMKFAQAEANRQEAESLLAQAEGELTQVQNELMAEQRKLQIAQQGNRLERDATNLLSQLSPETNRENALRLLIQAVKIGQELERLVQTESLPLANYPATNPLLTLQSILDRLNELDKTTTPQRRGANPEELFSKVDAALTSISHSPDGKYLAFGDRTGRIQIYTTNPKRQIKDFSTKSGAISDLALSPDGQKLVILGNDGTLKVWNQAGDNIGTFQDETGLIFGFALSQNGQFLGTRDGAGIVKIWPWSWQVLSQFSNGQTFTATPLQTVAMEQSRITSMSFSPDNGSLAITDQNGAVYTRSLREANAVNTSFDSFQAQVRQVLFSPDGSRIAIVGQNGVVTIWNLNGRQLSYIRHAAYRAVDASFDETGTYLAVAYEDGSARLHKMRNLNDLLVQGCMVLQPYRQEYQGIDELCQP